MMRSLVALRAAMTSRTSPPRLTLSTYRSRATGWEKGPHRWNSRKVEHCRQGQDWHNPFEIS